VSKAKNSINVTVAPPSLQFIDINWDELVGEVEGMVVEIITPAPKRVCICIAGRSRFCDAHVED
jgi:hypothetical protein